MAADARGATANVACARGSAATPVGGFPRGTRYFPDSRRPREAPRGRRQRRAARAGLRRPPSRVPAGPGPRGPGRTPTSALRHALRPGRSPHDRAGQGTPGRAGEGDARLGAARTWSPQSPPTTPAGRPRRREHDTRWGTNLPPGLLGPNPRVRPRALPRPPSRGIRSGTLRGPPRPHCACAGAPRTAPSPEQGCARRAKPHPGPWSRASPWSRSLPWSRPPPSTPRPRSGSAPGGASATPSRPRRAKISASRDGRRRPPGPADAASGRPRAGGRTRQTRGPGVRR